LSYFSNYNDKTSKNLKRQLNTKKIIATIRKNVFKKKYPCIVEGCENSAINSHLLQRNGILNNISIDSHLFELKTIDPNRWNRDKPIFRLERVSERNAISLKLYCSYHDNDLFSLIENAPVNFDDYNNQLLFSLRVIDAEFRKKEINTEIYNRFLSSRSLDRHINKYAIGEALEGNSMGINDLNQSKTRVQCELEMNNHQFIFRVKLLFITLFDTHHINIIKIFI
jgi:hypothetical protein